MPQKYRPDIDGLRALAVLSVIFYHFGISMFSGGYVGVDIFFVISGYLITTIIVSDIDAGNFTITKFYERRFRRILPALLVVVIASLIAGYFLLSPTSLVDLGKSAVATALFSSNILFFFESGYFDSPAELKPFLHTWSLAVEEQYYIFFPIILALIANLDEKRYFRWLFFMLCVSIIICITYTSKNSSFAFYWIPARAWELFIGSLLAIKIIPNTHKPFLCELYSLLGIALIGYSIYFYSEDTLFPGWAALLPTIGAALIIYSGTSIRPVISRFFSRPPIVFVGFISYSLYLWHWPVLVYTKIFFIKELTFSVMIGAISATFILSVLSWKYIETPFRKKIIFNEKNTLFSASAIASISIIFIGLVLVFNEGYPKRLGVSSDSYAKDPEWHHWHTCEDVVERFSYDHELCNLGSTHEQVKFILWGDSHARALASGVNSSASHMGLRGEIATRSACPPLLGVERSGRDSCNDFNQRVLKHIATEPTLEIVILAARWTLSSQGTRYKNEAGSSVQLVDLESDGTGELSNFEVFKKGLTRTIEELQKLDKKVLIVTPVPEVGYDVPSANVVTNLTGQDINTVIAPTLKEYRARSEQATAFFRQLKQQRSIGLVTPDNYLCNTSYCQVYFENTPLYRDDNHLSTFGSEYVSQAFIDAFDELVRKLSKKNPPIRNG
jgi:peptidoglycan/LPS O-acetylase OafA/YrhL